MVMIGKHNVVCDAIELKTCTGSFLVDRRCLGLAIAFSVKPYAGADCSLRTNSSTIDAWSCLDYQQDRNDNCAFACLVDMI